VGFRYDQATLSQTGQFTYTGEGWGMTYDGQRLIVSNGSSTLTFRDQQTFAVLGTLSVTADGAPVNRLNELEYVNGEIYANVWLTNRIARISPATGEVTGWIDLTGLRPASTQGDVDAVPNGIAYDSANGRLFVTGKRWPVLYEIRLTPPQ
jgi:glutamine cyclotransferase